MFKFGKSRKDPLADPRTADRWLKTLPAADPLATHDALLGAIGRLTEPDARRTPARLAAVFLVDAYADGLRATLTAQYLEHSHRSTQIENQLWQALFDLTQRFLLCYRGFTQAINSHPQDKKWQALLPELIARQIIHHGLEAKIRLYRYEQWIPGKWAELHALFQMACSAQNERKALGLGPGGGLTTIEQEYLRVLVLQLMNAGNLTPRHQEWLAQQLCEWCGPLRLTMESSPVTSFYVDLDARGGLKRRGAQLAEGRLLFLDTRPLHAVLMQNAVMLEHKVRNNPLSEKTPRRADQLNLLTKLASSIDAQRARENSGTGAAQTRQLHLHGWCMGDARRVAQRLSARCTDERGQRGHARDTGSCPVAERTVVDAGHCAADEAAYERARRAWPAAHCQQPCWSRARGTAAPWTDRLLGQWRHARD